MFCPTGRKKFTEVLTEIIIISAIFQLIIVLSEIYSYGSTGCNLTNVFVPVASLIQTASIRPLSLCPVKTSVGRFS
jgi:hypothetical protein